jgi:hypothetical protein
MGGEGVEVHDLGSDGHVSAEDAECAGTCEEGRATCAACLEPGEQYCVVVIGAVGGEVVEDAPAGEHSARRDDHHRSAAQVEQLRFVDGLDDGREPVHPLDLIVADAVLFRMPTVQVGDIGGHRAVDEDRDVGDLVAIAPA